MGKNFDIEKGVYGPSMVVKGTWKKGNAKYMIENHIEEVVFNTARGWRITDTKFLKDLGFLKAISISGIGDPVKEVAGVHYLNKLKYLNIQTYCKDPVDFTCFPDLEECYFEWRPKSDSLFQCTKLKKLWLNCLKKKDTEPFSNLVNLEWLAFGNGPIESLEGLRNLQKLKHLEFYLLRKLTSLAGLGKLKNLRFLEIHSCRNFKTLDEIQSLKNLEVLWLLNCGNIESLKPLLKLKKLKDYMTYESTNIVDGDMSPLLKLKTLKRISNGPVKKHYSHEICIGHEDEDIIIDRRGSMAANEKVAMSDKTFWSIIESTSSQGNQKKQLKALKKALSKLSEKELLDFDRVYTKFLDKAYRWDLWAAAFIINGGCSDDEFDYFRDWLIAQGKTTYVNALKNPETLINIAIPYDTEFEEFRYVVQEVFEEKFDKEMSYEFRDQPAEPKGKEWSEEDVDKKYPKLAKWVKKFKP